MAAKVTLYFQDESLLPEIKLYTRKAKTSLSRIIEIYLKGLLHKPNGKKSIVKKFSGVVNFPNGYSYKDVLSEMSQKYEK